MGKERDSSFEVLRIIAMIGIVFDHLSVHGLPLLPPPQQLYSINDYLLFSIPFDIFGSIGNYIFIFISAWFLSGKSFSWKKLGVLWFQICSTSVIITAVVFLLKLQIINYEDVGRLQTEGFDALARTITKKSLVKSLLPFYFSSNWYGSTYTVFFILLPLIDRLVNSLSQKEHKYYTILLIVLAQTRLLYGESVFGISKLIIFIAGYFLIKYVKNYGPDFLKNKKRNALIAVCLLAVHWFYKIACCFAFYKTGLPDNYFLILSRIPDNVACFVPMIIGLMIFLNIKDMKIPQNRLVNVVASTTFGIYLIHEHPLINYWWCHKVLRLGEHTEFVPFTGYVLLGVIVTFVVCSVVEFIRKMAIEKSIFYVTEKINAKDRI